MGASGGLGDQIWVSVVSDSRLTGLETTLWKLSLELLWRGQMRILIISLKELLWENGTKYWFLYHANPSHYMFSTSDVFCSITLVYFLILRMLISFKVACIVELTNLYKMYAPSLDPYIFQRLHSWPQDGGGLARFNSF